MNEEKFIAVKAEIPKSLKLRFFSLLALRGEKFKWWLKNQIEDCLFKEKSMHNISERQATIMKLREICGVYGDNEWDDNMCLQDVLEHHLLSHLQLIYKE